MDILNSSLFHRVVHISRRDGFIDAIDDSVDALEDPDVDSDPLNLLIHTEEDIIRKNPTISLHQLRHELKIAIDSKL